MKERDILKIYNNYCIIGMSPDPKKYSYQLYQCLKNAGKHVYGISPKYDTIDNDKMYTSLIDIEYPVDVVVFVVNKTIGMTYIREMRESLVLSMPGCSQELMMKIYFMLFMIRE